MKTVSNRLIAVCDILGFKELVRTRPLSVLVDKDLSLFQRLAGFCVKHGSVPDVPPKLVEMRDQGRVGFAWYSDTVIIYAQNDEDISCRNVLETVGWLVFTSMMTSTKIRAGIAYGEFYADPDNEMLVGPAVVDAYELEQAQQWAGAALTTDAASRIPKRVSTGARYQWWLCEYDVPLKPNAGANCSNLAIDWTQFGHRGTKFKWSPQSDEPTAEDYTTRRSICEKWHNLIKFHESVCVECFPENGGRDPLKVL